jgi:hypothetical protein
MVMFAASLRVMPDSVVTGAAGTVTKLAGNGVTVKISQMVVDIGVSWSSPVKRA